MWCDVKWLEIISTSILTHYTVYTIRYTVEWTYVQFTIIVTSDWMVHYERYIMKGTLYNINTTSNSWQLNSNAKAILHIDKTQCIIIQQVYIELLLVVITSVGHM